MVFGLGPAELLVILVIVIFIYGGKRLGEVGKALGDSVTQFKAGFRANQPEVRDADYKELEGRDEKPSGPRENKGA
ncbi:MAG: twin-arginine translocase TatA/TatE family subunit [Desulfosoma sp.]